MAYLTATRHGLTKVSDSDRIAPAYTSEWKHPSGVRALRHPCEPIWCIAVFDGWWCVLDGWSSSLRAAARRIDRLAKDASHERSRI
jgi:hypothetical protein